MACFKNKMEFHEILSESGRRSSRTFFTVNETGKTGKRNCRFIMMRNNKIFLYIGLSLLLVALVLREVGIVSPLWVPIFSLAILLKALFLFNIVRSKDLKMSLWLLLICIGVVLLLISLLFKSVFHVPLLRDILFYAAITLKTTGLVLMFVEKIKLSRNGNKSA